MTARTTVSYSSTNTFKYTLSSDSTNTFIKCLANKMYPDYNTRLYLIAELTGTTTQTWTVSVLNISNQAGVNYIYSSSPDKFNYGARSQAYE